VFSHARATESKQFLEEDGATGVKLKSGWIFGNDREYVPILVTSTF
jgi:hypothetical protein